MRSPPLRQYEKRYDELVAKGSALLIQMRKNSLDYDELRRMVNRLYGHRDTCLLFMREYAILFTNN